MEIETKRIGVFYFHFISLQGDGGGDEDFVARLSRHRDSIIASMKEAENGEVVFKEEGEDKDLDEEEQRTRFLQRVLLY